MLGRKIALATRPIDPALRPCHRRRWRRPNCRPSSRSSGRSRPPASGVAPAPRSNSRSGSYDTFLRKLLLELRAKTRAAERLAHELVVRDAREEVVALGGHVLAGRPLLALQIDVRLLLRLLHALEQVRQAERRRVLRAQRDEHELVAELAELRESDRVGVVEPLERARPVEREPRLREAAAHLIGEALDRLALRRRELAPHKVRDPRVEVPERALDREVEATGRLGRVDG